MIGAHLGETAGPAAVRLLNARDLDGFMKAPPMTWVFDFPGRIVGSGQQVGQGFMRAFFEMAFDLHPEILFTLRRVAAEQVAAMGGTNDVLVEWDLEANAAAADQDSDRA